MTSKISAKEGLKPLSRSRKSKKKRDAIIRAAILVINAKSYAQATMTEIAASLDLRDATLYYYFPSKQALVYACHLNSLVRIEILLDASEESGGTGIVRLKAFILSLLKDSDQNGALLYFGDYSYLDKTQRAHIDERITFLTSKLEKFVEDGMIDGSVVRCEPQIVVQLIIGMLIWLAKWTYTIDGLTVDRLMQAIDDFSIHGLESRET